MNAPWNLANATLADLQTHGPFEVAVLPLGATEPHNLHLPHGTDTFQLDAIGDRACAAAWEAGGKVVLLPTMPYGTETNLRECPLAINVNPSTLNAVIGDIASSLLDFGIRKLVLLNGHGGNDFKALVREMHGSPEFGQRGGHVFLCNWYQTCGDVTGEIFDSPGEHADEIETSLGLAFFPELVARNEDGTLAADDGATRKTQFTAINAGWVSITRPFHLLTTNTGVGNPHAATAEKGKQLMDVLVSRIGTFLAELAQAEITERFPF